LGGRPQAYGAVWFDAEPPEAEELAKNPGSFAGAGAFGAEARLNRQVHTSVL